MSGMTITGQHKPEVAERVSKALKKVQERKKRLRKYEADPATLHPDDRPTGVKLRVDPDAMAALCQAMGVKR